MTRKIEDEVVAHYTRSGLLESILRGLTDQGVDLDTVTTQDLAPVDEFHTAGRLSTVKALDLTPIQTGMRILDAGCGIGGTSRYLARDRGCQVDGIDLTPEYIDVARQLAGKMGLDQTCRFHVGSILEMPFPSETFDGSVNFHVAMNIDARSALYGELARVLKPDGFLCIFDVMKGPTDGMIYPVPWAETEETSFLKSRAETAALVEEAGFKIINEENLREFAIEFFDDVFANLAKAGGPPPLGLHLLTGTNTSEKFTNFSDALKRHQIEPVILVAHKV